MEKRIDAILAAPEHRDAKQVSQEERRKFKQKSIQRLIDSPKDRQFFQLFTNTAKDGVKLELLDETLELANSFPEDHSHYRSEVFPVLCQLRNAYEDQGEKEKAQSLQKTCEKMLETFPQTSELDKRDYVRTLIQFGDTEKAWKRLQEFPKSNSDRGFYLKELIFELVRAKEHAKALELVNLVPEYDSLGSDIEKYNMLLEVAKRQIETDVPV